jgi:hypothetical protein
MQGQTTRYRLVRRAACAIVSLACCIPALAMRREDGAAVVRAELDAWTQAFNAREADKICGIFSEDLRYKFGQVRIGATAMYAMRYAARWTTQRIALTTLSICKRSWSTVILPSSD